LKTIHGACPHDCPDTCAWLVTVDDAGTAVKLTGDPDHPFTQGALCSKLKRYRERVYSGERVLYPLRRSGAKGSGEFTRIGWDEALAIIVDRLRDSLAAHGPLTAMPCNFAGTIGLLQRYAGDQFFARLGASGLDSRICGNVCYDAIHTTVGSTDTMEPEDVEHSRFILIWGNNTAATNVHLWSGPIRRARDAGAKVVVVDPVRTITAAHADWHIQPRPATDGALALGLMHVIFRDGLEDADFVARCTLGSEELRERVRDYPPQRVAEITGVSVADIERLAREYATTRPAVLRIMVGIERYSNGFMTIRALACLPALIGAWRERGGGLLSFTVDSFFKACDYSVVLPPQDLPPPGRTLHLSQLGRVLTDAALAPPITWLLVYNLNPAVTMPNQNLIIEGLRREDLFTVVHEQFITETARYADIVLPATMQFEHLDLMPSWGQHYLALNVPAIAPLGEAIPNTELFRRLSRAMGYTDPCLLRSDEERARGLLASGSPLLAGITYERLQAEGWARLALSGDHRPRAAGDFGTPSGRCEFYSETLAKQGMDPLPGYVPYAGEAGDAARWPLQLVSAKTAHFLNSEYVNLRHRGTRDHRPEVNIHPVDAASRAIASGDRVRMFNRYGTVEVTARVSEDTGAGVVYMPFNWWMASTFNGSSANALTPDGLSDRDYGSDAFDARVQIERVA